MTFLEASGEVKTKELTEGKAGNGRGKTPLPGKPEARIQVLFHQ